MAVNQLDALPHENVVIEGQCEPECRVRSLQGHVRVRQVVNLDTVGKESDALSVGVSVCEDNNTMAKCCQSLTQIVNVIFNAPKVWIKKIANHTISNRSVKG